MEKLRELLERDAELAAGRTDVDDLPIPVAEDWDAIVSRADKVAGVIDRHLDFESKLQGRQLRPVTLCPEQRVSLVSDLAGV